MQFSENHLWFWCWDPQTETFNICSSTLKTVIMWSHCQWGEGAVRKHSTTQHNITPWNCDKVKFLLPLSVAEPPLVLFGKVTLDNCQRFFFDCRQKVPSGDAAYFAAAAALVVGRGRASLPVPWKVTADTTNIPVWIAGRSVSQLCMSLFLLTAL